MAMASASAIVDVVDLEADQNGEGKEKDDDEICVISDSADIDGQQASVSSTSSSWMPPSDPAQAKFQLVCCDVNEREILRRKILMAGARCEEWNAEDAYDPSATHLIVGSKDLQRIEEKTGRSLMGPLYPKVLAFMASGKPVLTRDFICGKKESVIICSTHSSPVVQTASTLASSTAEADDSSTPRFCSSTLRPTPDHRGDT